MKEKPQVFLSYAREDETKVTELYERLSSEGLKPWMDRLDILAGRKWKPSIRQVIRQSDFFLACLSKNSVNKRGYIQQEIKEALDVLQEKLDSDVFLIPVRLEECQVPENLQDIQRVDLFQAGGWEKLVKAMRVQSGDLTGGEQTSFQESIPNQQNVKSQTKTQSQPVQKRSGKGTQNSMAKQGLSSHPKQEATMMSLSNSTYLSEAVEKRFSGRQEALGIFYQRFAYRHMKNAVYYYGPGGIGKTWLLRKIELDNRGNPMRTVADLIDFFDTANQSIRGLQSTIQSRLESTASPDVFEPYKRALAQLDSARQEKKADYPGLIASLEKRADKLFIECCKQAVLGREIVLLFDTFERVQQRYAGHWFLTEFLPQVRDLIVVIVGRPIPFPAPIPDNVIPFELVGMSLEEVKEYVARTFPLPISDELVERVWQHAQGHPLLIDLIFDLTSVGFIAGTEIEKVARIQNSATLKRELTGHFSQGTNLDRVIWAMGFLKRRFDLGILQHIVENGELFDSDVRDYGHIIDELRQFKFFKEYPEQESHLLHDEMQQIIESYLLERVDPECMIRNTLYDLVVVGYYDRLIATVQDEGRFAFARQLRAEQVGYLLDRDPEAGLEKYLFHRSEIDRSNEYDFEELLWEEVREQLVALRDSGYKAYKERGEWLHAPPIIRKRLRQGSYKVYKERGEWLRQHRLFDKAVAHYREMLTHFPEVEVETRKSLAFSLLRQGEVEEAMSILNQGRALVVEGEHDHVAEYENLAGQISRAAGFWNEALKHYTLAANAFMQTKNISGLAGAFTNRGYLYALQGMYQDAVEECKRALALLDSLTKDDVQTRMHTYMNLGTANRYSGEYDRANQNYRLAEKIANRVKNQEVLCRVWQLIGITFYLKGRTVRQENKSLLQAAKNQLAAWENLIRALELAQAANWETALADGLSRLARVYEEIHEIEQQMDDSDLASELFRETFETLQVKAGKIHPPGEVEYEYDLLVKPFSQQNWLGKSAQLFELSALIADQAYDSHRALDSLMELARLLLALKQYDNVSLVIRRTERLKGYDYQEELFSAMSEITLADLAFDQAKHEIALGKYVDAYAQIAKQTGYASYLLPARLRGLDQRMRSLPSPTRLAWCDTLEQGWLEQSVSASRPEMFRLLEDIRFDTLQGK